MEKVICITSCISSTGLIGINSGDIFWTPYNKVDLKNRSIRWISLYRTNPMLREFYIGAFELINFCELGDWRESRMGQVLD